MSEQADAPEREDEDLHIDNQDDAGAAGDDQGDDEGDGQANDQDDDQGEGGDAEDEDEFEITFGDEAAPASKGNDSDLVKHLRQVNREQAEKLAKYERGEIPAPQPRKIEVGEKPTLESCDYDEAKFETELDAWKERKRQADEAEAQITQRTQAEQQRFAKKLEGFAAGKTALKVRDFDAAETAVVSTLSQVQQAVIIEAADDAAKLIYALGRHPEKLKSLAAIENPIEFTKALVKLEGQLKVTQRRTPPDPDRPQRGSAPLASGTDKTLERLEREAAKTGDRSAVIRYKRQLRAQGRS